MKKFLAKFYSPQLCNTQRQYELDIFRFILIYRLAVAHVFVTTAPPGSLDTLSVPYYFDSIVGGIIGAPRFMLMMGIGLAYSHCSRLLFRLGLEHSFHAARTGLVAVESKNKKEKSR